MIALRASVSYQNGKPVRVLHSVFRNMSWWSMEEHMLIHAT
jgi:hypothetical protein